MLGLETIYSFDNNETRINYLNSLLDAFREYMITNNLFDSNYDPFFLYVYNYGKMFEAESLTNTMLNHTPEFS